MPTIKITSNGAVTLPAQIRKALGLKNRGFCKCRIKKGPGGA